RRLRQVESSFAAGGNPAMAKSYGDQAKAHDDHAKLIYETLAKYGEPTGPMKEFGIGRNPGETLPAYQARVKGEEKSAEESAARYGKRYEAVTKVGDEADETLPQLNLAKTLVNSPNFYSGSGAGFVDAVKRLAVAMGLDPNRATANEVFDKIRAGSI